MNTWQYAGGTTIGRTHRVSGKSNQDAWHVRQDDGRLIAVVADGCGSGAHSEVGSHLAVQMITELIVQQLATGKSLNWRQLERGLTSQFDVLARRFSSGYRQAIEQFFLFTLVGVVISQDDAVFFACGDGAYVVNGEAHQIGPFEGNMPPYINYQLLQGSLMIEETSLRILPVHEMPASELESFLIGTDGLDDFVSHEAHQRPGLPQAVGPLSQFWQDDRYFRGNPELVSRELRLIGRDWPYVSPEPGLLSDDTTIVVGRRIPSE